MKGTIMNTLSMFIMLNNTIKATNLLNQRPQISLLHRDSLSALTLTNSYLSNLHSPSFHHGYLRPSISFESQSIQINDNANLEDVIEVSDKDLLVKSPTISQKFKSFKVINSNAQFDKTEFNIPATTNLITAKLSNINIKNCRFSTAKTTPIYVTSESNLKVENSVFQDLNGKFGGAIYFSGNEIFLSGTLFLNCQASKAGGAIFINSSEKITFKDLSFVANYAPVASSIYLYTNATYSLDSCMIPKPIEQEVVKRSSGSRGIQAIDEKSYTPPPTQSPTSSIYIPTPTDSHTPTTAQTPNATQTPIATPSFIKQTEIPAKTTSYIVFTAVICGGVIILVVTITIILLVQKKKNQIYPTDDEDDDVEPQKTTVVIPNMYAVNSELP